MDVNDAGTCRSDLRLFLRVSCAFVGVVNEQSGRREEDPRVWFCTEIRRRVVELGRHEFLYCASESSGQLDTAGCFTRKESPAEGHHLGILT